MSATVWKYAVTMQDAFTLTMPKGAQILHVGTQHSAPMLWARVDPSAPVEARTFRVAGTGHDLGRASDWPYVGTFQMAGGALVFHLFETA